MKNIREQKPRRETRSGVTALSYEARRALNPACSSKRNVVQLASTYQPPVLGTQQEFCTEAILKGVPVLHCKLEKPVQPHPDRSLLGESPEKDPAPARSLQNWGKWCDEWNRTQLRVRPTDPNPPSIMTSGEGHRRKKEDIELISRTLPPRSLYGYNPFYPPCTSNVEGLTKPIYRKQPVERIRIPRDIRDELCLPYRQVDECYTPQLDDAPQTSWQWEKNWKKTIPVGVAKLFLRRDMEQESGKPINEDSLFLYGVKASREGEESDEEGIPQLVFNGPTVEVRGRGEHRVAQDLQKPGNEADVYSELHGPILLINGPTMTLVMRQRQAAQPPVEEFIFDKMEEFATTTQCKETRHLRLVNKGTTSIRYQWLRCQPNRYLRRLLANPGKVLQLEQETQPGVPPPVDLLKPILPCRPIGEGTKKLAVKLTTSRRVDPYLTRTIKILRNSISANPAYENFLLLLSFRIPRLRRVLIRRTGRQLAHSTLPPRIRDLYLKLLEDRKLFRGRARASTRRLQLKRSLARRRRQNQVAKSESKARTRSRTRSRFRRRKKLKEEAREKCRQIEAALALEESTRLENERCKCGDPTMGPDGEEECQVCECDLPGMEESGEWDEEEQAETPGIMEFVPEDLEALETEVELAGEDAGESSEGFELEQMGESNDQLWVPAGTTDQFYPLNYGSANAQGDWEMEAPDDDTVTEFIKPPPPGQSWDKKQRKSLQDPASILKRQPSSDRDINQNEGPAKYVCPIFTELKGYEVKQDYDAEKHLTRIEIGPERIPPTSAEQGDSGRDRETLGEACSTEGVPVRPTPETHRLNTQIPDEHLHHLIRHRDEAEGVIADPDGLDQDQEQADFEKDLLHRHFSSLGSISLSPSFIQQFLDRNSTLVSHHPCNEEEGECDDPYHDGAFLPHAFLRFNENRHLLSESSLPTQRYTHGHPESKGFEEREKAATQRMKAHLDKMLKKRVEAVLKKIPKVNRVRFVKEPCYDFHFRELPGVLLPGQTDKLEIIFRPRKPGYYNEKLYLMTHPRLGDANFGIQLCGICMDPDFKAPRNQEKTGSPKTEKVDKMFTNIMRERQSRRAMEAIVDSVLNMKNASKKSSLPYGRVSSEELFYAHNPNLYYHHGVSERSLDIVRNLVGYFIPDGVLPPHPKLCHLNIEGLYQKICEPVDINNPNDFFWKNLCNPEMGDLIKEFRKTTKIMSRPPVTYTVPSAERKYLSVSSCLTAIIDEAMKKIKRVERNLAHPNREFLVRRAVQDRLDQRRARETELRKRSEARNNLLRKPKKEKLTMIDEATQKPNPLSADPSEIQMPLPDSEADEGEEDIGDESTSTKSQSGGKTKKKGKDHKTKTKGKKGKINDKPTEAKKSMASTSTRSTKSTKSVGKPVTPTPDSTTSAAEPGSIPGGLPVGSPEAPVDPILEAQVTSIRQKNSYQMVHMVIQDVFDRGLDRLLYTIDSLNTMPEPRESPIAFKPKPWYEAEVSPPETVADQERLKQIYNNTRHYD